jgi:hypothetical protein
MQTARRRRVRCQFDAAAVTPRPYPRRSGC